MTDKGSYSLNIGKALQSAIKGPVTLIAGLFFILLISGFSLMDGLAILTPYITIGSVFAALALAYFLISKSGSSITLDILLGFIIISIPALFIIYILSVLGA